MSRTAPSSTTSARYEHHGVELAALGGDKCGQLFERIAAMTSSLP
ncbi:hypothetical protein [Mesorhizobium australicum]